MRLRPSRHAALAPVAPFAPLALATSASAHAPGVRSIPPASAWATWAREPWVLATLLVLALAYAARVAVVWGRSHAGAGVRAWEVVAFAGGWLALLVALASPLDPLAGLLFSAHMAQHELLILVAAPLLVLGRPLVPLLWTLPRSARLALSAAGRGSPIAATWSFLTQPLVAWLLHAIALWAWHAPAAYEAALRSDFVHALQHLSFLGSASLLWWAIVHGRYGRLGYGVAVLAVFTTGLHGGALGALLTVAPRVLYPHYEEAATAWGLSALEDQQVAGLVMWIPSGVGLLVLGLALSAAWLGVMRRRDAMEQAP
jgi:putative membrane protein